MESKTIHFYYDFLSPYTYLAWFNLKPVLKKYSLKLQPHPVVLGALLSKWEHKGPAEIPPKKVFTFKDCIRKADQAGVSFYPPPNHPFNPLMALRLTQTEVAGGQQVKTIDTLWRAIWGEGKSGDDPKVLQGILDQAGLPGAEWIARTQETEIKTALRRQTEEAIAQGVFGVPTFILDGELFWGNDQMNYLKMFIENQDPVRYRDMEEILSRPATAHR